jgi:hypothetical protein
MTTHPLVAPERITGIKKQDIVDAMDVYTVFRTYYIHTTQCGIFYIFMFWDKAAMDSQVVYSD